MTERLVRLPAPESAVWRTAIFGLAIVMLVCGSVLLASVLASGQPVVSLWLPLVYAAGGVSVALAAALRDATEVWVRPEGLAVRQRNPFRTREHSIPAADVKAIGVRADWLGQVFIPRMMTSPHVWNVVIDTAHHGRIRGGGAASEKEA